MSDTKNILAFRAHMGHAPSYIASVPLSWVAKHIKFAGDMPQLIDNVNPVSKEIMVDDFSIDHLQQRRPDWRRQLPMTVYLTAWEKHKFPPLLVSGQISAIPLENGLYKLSIDDNTVLYALDGQHRLMAIQGVQELLNNERLPARNQDGKAKQAGEVRFQHIAYAVEKQSGKKLNNAAVADRLQGIMNEEIGIEIIPTMDAKELRSIFVDVNENAKKPSKGEAILLDNRNGFRIVAQDVMVSHKLLQKRVLVQRSYLAESSTNYTTLETLASIATLYLGYDGQFSNWKIPLIPHDKSSGFMRPRDGADIGEGINELLAFFSELVRLPSHTDMVGNNNLTAADFRVGEDSHMLFRPIAQMAFAEASAILKHHCGIPVADSVDKLIRQEKCGQLKLKCPKAPWCGVIWDAIGDGKMRRGVGGPQKLCMHLFVYLLGGNLDDPTLNQLLKTTLGQLKLKYAVERKFYGGEDASEILPAPWQ